MNETNQPLPAGETRTHVARDHALIGPDSHVRAALPDWGDAECVVLISPAMGAGPRAPRFCQYLVHAGKTNATRSTAAGIERLIYVLEGEASFDGEQLPVDSFVWLPPESNYKLQIAATATLLVFDKLYVPLDGVTTPKRVSGALRESPAEPFLGDPDAMLSTLLPKDQGFDMVVNVFNYKSGATLPFVETHIMEHGLYMRSGQGVYRLSDCWYPVKKGDVMWMAAFCPQWFVACGKEPASYIYYKDMNRCPLGESSGANRG